MDLAQEDFAPTITEIAFLNLVQGRVEGIMECYIDPSFTFR